MRSHPAAFVDRLHHALVDVALAERRERADAVIGLAQLAALADLSCTYCHSSRCSESWGRKRADRLSARLVVRMTLSPVREATASSSWKTSPSTVMTLQPKRSLSLTMSPMIFWTSHGAHCLGRLRTAKKRQSNCVGDDLADHRRAVWSPRRWGGSARS